MTELAANLPGNQICSNFPRRQVGKPLKAHSGKHRALWERNKGSAEDNETGVSISVMKEFLVLSFLRVCVPTGELATKLEPTRSGMWKKKPYLLDTREIFTVIKLLFSSIPFVQPNKTCYKRFSGHFWASCQFYHLQKARNVLDKGPWSTLGLLFFWQHSWRL